MPVIACPDCGRDVSTLAPACPHCGRPSPAGLVEPPGSAAAPARREETLWRGTPSPVLLVGKIALLVFIVVAILLVAHFFALTAADDLAKARNVRMAGWVIAAILAVVQLVALGVAWLKLRSTLYIITNQRVMIEEGILSKTVNEIDLRYVDDSQFFQGLTDRMLGIGNVTLHSSDANTPNYMLRSIRDPRSVRELIRTHAYQVSQRQIITRDAR
ncbi:MAG TPA: PH domain-containing protein [Thermoanaerobaculia bacterium]|nr:PH domain-containing protein [Thermoanaerobaculia bacterium]